MERIIYRSILGRGCTAGGRGGGGGGNCSVSLDMIPVLIPFHEWGSFTAREGRTLAPEGGGGHNG